jgi:hypothetical protein
MWDKLFFCYILRHDFFIFLQTNGDLLHPIYIFATCAFSKCGKSFCYMSHVFSIFPRVMLKSDIAFQKCYMHTYKNVTSGIFLQ